MALALAANRRKGHKGMHHKGFGARLHTTVTQQELEALPHRAMQHTELGVWLHRAAQHMALGVFAPQQD